MGAPRTLVGRVLVVAATNRAADAACAALGLPRSTPRLTPHGAGDRAHAGLLADTIIWVEGWQDGPERGVQNVEGIVRRMKAKRPQAPTEREVTL